MTTPQVAPHFRQPGHAFVTDFHCEDLEALNLALIDPTSKKPYNPRHHAKMPNHWVIAATCNGPPAYPNGRDNTIVRLVVSARLTPSAADRAVALSFEFGVSKKKQIQLSPYQTEWFLSFIPKVLEVMNWVEEFLYALGAVQSGLAPDLAKAKTLGYVASQPAIIPPTPYIENTVDYESVVRGTINKSGFVEHGRFEGPTFAEGIDPAYDLIASVVMQTKEPQYKTRNLHLFEKSRGMSMATLSKTQVAWLGSIGEDITQRLASAELRLRTIEKFLRGLYSSVDEALMAEELEA